MKIVMLPGYDQTNIAWLSSAKFDLLPKLPEKQLFHYRHWEDDSVKFDPQSEVERFMEQSGDGHNTLLIAKSVGVLLALIANYSYHYRPDAAIFMGTPVKQNRIEYLDKNFTELVRKADFPILFIQQLSDRLCSYANLEKILNRCAKWNLLVEPITGQDHLYDQFAEIDLLTSGWYESMQKVANY